MIRLHPLRGVRVTMEVKSLRCREFRALEAPSRFPLAAGVRDG